MEITEEPEIELDRGKRPAVEGRNVDPNRGKKKQNETGKSGRFGFAALKLSPRSLPSETSLGGKSVPWSSTSHTLPSKWEGRNVDPDCVNASNPFHQCGEYCTKKKPSEKGKSGRFALSLLKMSPRSPSKRSIGGKSVQSRERAKVIGRNVDPSCPNASNPFHVCAEYCTEKTVDARKQSRTGKQVQNGEGSMRGMQMDSISVSSSNSFHQRTPEANMPTNGNTLGDLLARESMEEGALIRENRNEEAIIRENRKVVDSRCPNASNPFHECAEYCHKSVGGSSRSEKSKPDKNKGSSKFVMVTRDVDPRCLNASNPFHKCAEYCFEKTREAK